MDKDKQIKELEQETRDSCITIITMQEEINGLRRAIKILRDGDLTKKLKKAYAEFKKC